MEENGQVSLRCEQTIQNLRSSTSNKVRVCRGGGRLIFHVADVDVFWTHLKEKGFDPESPRDVAMASAERHSPR